jgi:hypothetical protein
MKSCLFWVKKKKAIDIIIPVFDVMQENPIRFLIYDQIEGGFSYERASKFLPLAETWEDASSVGVE